MDQCLITFFLGLRIGRTGILGVDGVGGVDAVVGVDEVNGADGVELIGVLGMFSCCILTMLDGFGLRTPAATSLVKVPLISEVNCQNMIPAFQRL